ncbi:hypothetical protein AGABI1DRAFT_134991 [Agaricus bisporus var. burnettii JB137-S8]|uniref:Uncharacterized protein n=1 Tax=Agaricus bisporus var. burnettii (strain JB137-S8 / ATCC MYA-4627 / FGSC 10392) TaxID=597362 RepID=K5WRG7_AGABU|nr:uncharacterized protein AGABI1DRAFT_134991 [Agaricus bisporus var. burnettii JB137-S8]EKM73348.1 hypothetical protein AGABI1DRAFT_134991 [Agaricus bisporus var. burnettii JB137-S8]
MASCYKPLMIFPEFVEILLLKRWAKGFMYAGNSSGFVGSGSFSSVSSLDCNRRIRGSKEMSVWEKT